MCCDIMLDRNYNPSPTDEIWTNDTAFLSSGSFLSKLSGTLPSSWVSRLQMLGTGQCLSCLLSRCASLLFSTKLALHLPTALSHTPSHAPSVKSEWAECQHFPSATSLARERAGGRGECVFSIKPLAWQTYSFLENSIELWRVSGGGGGLYYKVFPERENILTDLMEHAHARQVPSSWPQRTCLYIFCHLLKINIMSEIFAKAV